MDSHGAQENTEDAAAVARSWRWIADHVREHVRPADLAEYPIHPGAGEESLGELETSLGRPLPGGLIAFLRAHDGCDFWLHDGRDTFQFLSVAEILRELRDPHAAREAGRLLPLYRYPTGSTVHLDLDSGILRPRFHDEEEAADQGNTLSDLLAGIVRRVKSGRLFLESNRLQIRYCSDVWKRIEATSALDAKLNDDTDIFKSREFEEFVREQCGDYFSSPSDFLYSHGRRDGQIAAEGALFLGGRAYRYLSFDEITANFTFREKKRGLYIPALLESETGQIVWIDLGHETLAIGPAAGDLEILNLDWVDVLLETLDHFTGE